MKNSPKNVLWIALALPLISSAALAADPMKCTVLRSEAGAQTLVDRDLEVFADHPGGRFVSFPNTRIDLEIVEGFGGRSGAIILVSSLDRTKKGSLQRFTVSYPGSQKGFSLEMEAIKEGDRSLSIHCE